MLIKNYYNLLTSEISAKVLTKGDLIEQVFQVILEKGENGIFQTELCKAFSIDSRDGSRLVGNLEKQSLISREKMLYKGRWTYKLMIKKNQSSDESQKKPLDLSIIEGVPCISCSYQHLCSTDDDNSLYSPAKCSMIEEWILVDMDKKVLLDRE